MINKNIKAFTLAELAVVVVIISIILGAILAGDEVIEASERQSIIKEINKYSTALSTFSSQYLSLPGDMNNASEYWSGATNGNFDGYVKGYDTENIYAWNHLSRAEILPDNYDGTVADYEKSIPEATIGNAYFILDTAGDLSSGNDGWTISTNAIYEKEGNFLGIGGYSDSSRVANGALNSKSALAIDGKIDDGSASAGHLVFIRGTNDEGSTYQTGCVAGTDTGYSSAGAGAVDFDLTINEDSCRALYFYSEYE